MLSQEENQTLTQVGPGTPMGGLLRRYWHPVCAEAELDEHPVRALRLLGEDLVVFKCGDDAYAVIERWCAHRGTDLAFGYAEDCSLRCPRHGWLYSDAGQCLDMPLEDEPFTEDIRLQSYRAQAKAGMIWAYLGPEPVPLIPDWEPFGRQDGLVQVVFAALSCNWLQCQENSMDGIDMEELEAALEAAAGAGQLPSLPELDFEFDEFEHGFLVRQAGDDASNINKTSIWPNGLFAGDARSCRLEWRVPMDDTTTLIVAWFIDRVASGHELPFEQRVHYWYAPVRETEDGEAIRTHQLNKKFAVWLNQAPIVDRTAEYLSEGDEGVVLLRNKLFSQIELLADGGEPKGLIFDAGRNQRLELPATTPALVPSQREAVDSFPYIAGQPDEVAEAYRKVMATWARAQ
jgi:5,5'-dehydrodivanillate O-demethylase oxygenase subunit